MKKQNKLIYELFATRPKRHPLHLETRLLNKKKHLTENKERINIVYSKARVT